MERLFYWFLEDLETKEITIDYTADVFIGEIGDIVYKNNKTYVIKDYAEEWISD